MDVGVISKKLKTQLQSGSVVMPGLPDVAVRIRNALEKPDISASRIADLIKTDPVMSGKILQLANSSLYGVPGRKITDLGSAVTRLGYRAVRNAVMALAMQQVFQSIAYSGLKAKLGMVWRHSIKTAAIAAVIARNTGYADPGEALFAGLVHDIGKFYILQFLEAFPQIYDDDAALDLILSCHHGYAGRVILLGWGLPAHIVEVAEAHDDIFRSHTRKADMSDIVQVANIHAHVGEKNNPYEKFKWDEIGSFQRMNLDAETSIKIISESRRQIQEIISALTT